MRHGPTNRSDGSGRQDPQWQPRLDLGTCGIHFKVDYTNASHYRVLDIADIQGLIPYHRDTFIRGSNSSPPQNSAQCRNPNPHHLKTPAATSTSRLSSPRSLFTPKTSTRTRIISSINVSKTLLKTPSTRQNGTTAGAKLALQRPSSAKAPAKIAAP